MSDAAVARIKQWLHNHEQDLLNDTLQMLRIPSVEGPAEPNAPFGKACREALDLALDLGRQAGMQTTDLDGKVGFADFGQGERLIMSLGHLDVVPVGSGWKHEPFGAEIDGGYIYARGTQDDKGPTMASFYAMRAIKECCPELNVRFRQVFGCDEESGFECVKRYTETEESPTFGIAPDSGWPLYNAEKGIANLIVEVPLRQGEMTLLEACGGERPNIVIDGAEAAVRVSSSARAHVESKLADAWDRNVECQWEGDVLRLRARGKAAHGSTPYLGDSAAARIFRFLYEITPFTDEAFYEELLATTNSGGQGLGISGRDDVSKDLTSNLGVVTVENGVLRLLYNVRYPVTWTGADLRARCEAYLPKLKSGFRLAEMSDSPPLYFPLEHPLVKTIIDTYEAETGERLEPGSMGGGTYARAMPNTVSVGTGWEGDGKAHEADERMKVDHLFRMSRIYAHILYRLATLP